MPNVEQIIEMIAEQITTDLKSLNTRIADSAGKMMSAAVSSEPTRRIESETTMPISVAIKISYAFEGAPVAFAKSGSKVMAKILL